VKRRELFILLGGVATVWPFASRAQQKPMPVIGFLNATSPSPNDAKFDAAFLQGLSESGYVEGQNVAIEYRWAEGHYDRLPALVTDLIRRKVALITAFGIPSALAAKSATSTIPIVFTSGDPIGDGLVASLARPEANLTGISLLSVELVPKRFELISELVSHAKVVALLVNPKNPNVARTIEGVQEAAHRKGVQLPVLKASSEGEIDAAFAALVGLHGGALVVGSDIFFDGRREQFVTLGSRYAIPAIFELREFAAAGGLVSYGASLAAVIRQVGIAAGKIIKGAKPADLPVQQPTKFDLVINLTTAKALGLTIPQSILARADEVIE
jgi:putative ABC transport system substrate-binding protein